MKFLNRIGCAMSFAIAGLVSAPRAYSDDDSGTVVAASPLVSASTGDSVLSIETARDRVKVMHEIYAATLDMLHERYFHLDRAALPARAMQDIFSEIERQSKVEARWISASLRPMSIDHTPETKFEKRAAEEIAAGTAQLEEVEDGYYRRAVAIPLTGGCLGCHEGGFQHRLGKQFAGLVISMPLRDRAPAE